MSVPPFSSSRSSSWVSGSARLSRRQLELHDHILLWALPAIATRMNTGPRLIAERSRGKSAQGKVGVSRRLFPKCRSAVCARSGSFGQNRQPAIAGTINGVEWSGTPSSSHAAAAGPRRLQNEYNQGERKSRLIVNNRKIYKDFATEGRAA